jgi:hypothetical protein
MEALIDALLYINLLEWIGIVCLFITLYLMVMR